MKRISVLCWSLLILSTAAWGQISSAPPNAAGVLVVKAVLPVTAVAAGQTVTAAVVLQLQPGWHVNANKPTLDYLIPTVVTVSPTKGVTVGSLEYPRPSAVQFAFEKKPLDVYQGTALVRFPVSVAKDARGTLRLSGSLRYQPCKDVCLAPATKPFTLNIPIAAPGEAVKPANRNLFNAAPAAVAAGTTASTGDDKWADTLKTHGLLAFLGLIFLGGLALNLTPCVYPMIAVTMSIFGARAGDPRGRVLGRAVVYVLGMATMYTGLGVTAALTGKLFGSALQSTPVQLFIAAFLFVLALGMFGIYELQPPPKLASALGGQNRAGLAGIYFSGLVVGIFAAPCVGPVVLGLLTLVGQKHDVAFGSISFFTLALGLGAPYILLATSTRLMNRLPRSGDWLEWTKHIFGVILIGVAARYVVLSLAPDYVDFVVPVVLVGGAAYLAFWDAHGRSLPRFRATKTALGTLGILAGLYLGQAAWAGARAGHWPVYSDAELAAAAQAHQRVVMDFGASWCAECHELEAATLRDAEVRSALAPFRRVRVDLDGANKSQADALQKKYGVKGLPAIVFLDAAGNEISAARVSHFLPPKDFLRNVAEAKQG